MLARLRLDLVALVVLLALPTAHLVGRVDTAGRRERLYAELHALAVHKPAPPSDDEAIARLDAARAAWSELSAARFDDEVRADLDAVIAGDRPPWEISKRTRGVLAATDAATAAVLRGIEESGSVAGAPVSRAAFHDFGRQLVFVSIEARSKGNEVIADRLCALGFSLASRWPQAGDLSDILDADAMMERVWPRCADDMIVDREAFRAFVLPPPDMRVAVRREVAAVGLRFHGSVVGPLPADVPGLRWQEPSTPRTGAIERLVAVQVWADAECFHAPPLLPAAREAVRACEEVERKRLAAARALHLRQLEVALVIGRNALEDFVFERGVWPTNVDELCANDPALGSLLRDPVSGEPFTLHVHEPYATLMAVGDVSRAVRAARSDDGGDVVNED